MVDFDTIKNGNLPHRLRGTSERHQRPDVQAEREAAGVPLCRLCPQPGRGPPGGGASKSSGCSENGGDDGVVTLGSFNTRSVEPCRHQRGLTDQQAGTFMHEFGHLLGFGHGGYDGINCKPNYRSVMNYSRQFAGSPILNRRLDYSRSDDPCRPEQAGT